MKILSVISSWVTDRLSLHRFQTEMRWKRREKAYEKVLEALHHVKAFADANLEAIHENRKIPKERNELLLARAKDASLEIERAANLGGFYLGDEACKRLRQYQEDVKKALGTEDMHDYFDREWDAANSCLQDLIDIARHDSGP